LLIIAPWTVRNFIIFHEFIPTVANGGNNIQAGSSIKYLIPLNERIKIKQHKRLENSHEDILNKKVSSPNEYDALMWRAGWRNYKNAWQQNPLSVLKLIIYKAARF
jgi:hypothetical protein